MKTLLHVTIILFLLLFGLHCKKSNDPGNNSNFNSTPHPTAAGAPTGTKTSKLIPKTGGAMTSADGKLEIIFPAGALSADDTITIQPISNNCPGGKGLAYRLGPNGSKFNQPVTLKFHYADSVLKKTPANLMGVAFQDSTGIWYMLDNALNDTSQHIISAKTLHFTDFNWLSEVSIEPASATVKAGGALILMATNIALQDEAPGIAGYAILDGHKTIWAVNGVTNGNSQYGTITAQTNSPNSNINIENFAVYDAPNTVPANNNPVLVSAEFNQLFLASNPDGTVVKVNKAIVYSHIRIVDGGYHVELSFQVDSLNEEGSLWSWKDKGSFDVVLAGARGSVVNIDNSGAVIGLQANNTTCAVTLGFEGLAPINIVDSSVVGVNPVTKNITIIFNSLDQKKYIQFPIWNYACPGGDNGQLGGGYGPPFPAYIQFDMVDTVQTIVSGPYKIVVNAIK
jgi:hypothetical protein